jgi:hypothetical protein
MRGMALLGDRVTLPVSDAKRLLRRRHDRKSPQRGSCYDSVIDASNSLAYLRSRSLVASSPATQAKREA